MRASELAPSDRALLDDALAAQGHAHAPISNYAVGAALRAADGAVVRGCNVENIIFSLSLCAESVAISKAVSDGHRVFGDLAVVTSSTPPAAPCGSCRQMLSYWGIERVIVGNPDGEVMVLLLTDLLPRAFALREPLPRGGH